MYIDWYINQKKGENWHVLSFCANRLLCIGVVYNIEDIKMQTTKNDP